MGDKARSPRHRYSKCDKEYETVEEENYEGVIQQFPNVLSPAFPACGRQAQSAIPAYRQAGAFEYANFFMDEPKALWITEFLSYSLLPERAFLCRSSCRNMTISNLLALP